MLNSKTVFNIQDNSETTNSNADICGAIGCYAIGTQYIEIKLDNENVIQILTCNKCVKLLR